jgi:AraC-like DNA-binding protein
MGNKDNKYFVTWQISDNLTDIMDKNDFNFISPELVLILDSKALHQPLIYTNCLILTNEGRVFIITKGTIDVNINLLPFHASRGQILSFPIGAVVELLGWSDDFEYQCFVFKDLSMQESLRNPVLVNETDSLQERVKGYLHAMLLLTKEQPLNLQAVKHLQQAFLADIAACADQMHQQPHNQPEDYKEHYFLHFIELVNKYCTTEHNVSFYAGQLNISPNRLSAVIKAYSGKTVMQWLHHRLVLQAKVLLQNSQLSIGNIASCLGFKNQAEFTRFFKRATGISPKDYRNNINIPFI